MAIQAFRDSGLGHLLHKTGSEQYEECMSSYWSLQEAQIKAAAVLKPHTAEDISTAISVLHDLNRSDNFQSPFAIRSGGHQAYPGSANIEDGVVIDVRKLQHIELSEDRNTVTIGAGATFEDLYTFLEPYELSVPGARVAQVGIAGFTLGGGISFYSPQLGFTCDNVEESEIVLADGSVVTANLDQNSDLLKALKGGGNNFGIVTSITFRTILKQDLWGGSIIYGVEKYGEVIEEMYNQIVKSDDDKVAAIMCAIGLTKGIGEMAYASLKYTVPHKDPAIFSGFAEILQIINTMKIGSLAEVAYEEGKFSLAGERRLYTNCSFIANLSLLQDLSNIWRSTLQKVQHIQGIEWAFVLNPILPSAMKAGNVLGLSSEKPIINVLVMGTWHNSADDEYMGLTGKLALEMITTRAREFNVAHPFIYMNYAWKGQRVMDGYGAETKKWLQSVSKKYDPDGIFQKAVPGGFKLFDQ